MNDFRISSRLSNILWRECNCASCTLTDADQSASCRTFTSTNTSSHQFEEFFIKTPRFNLVMTRFTNNTYVLVVLPPGEAELNCTRINIATAREDFRTMDMLSDAERDDPGIEQEPGKMNGGGHRNGR